MIKLKKGSQAAKNYMAKIRAMRKGVKKAAKKVKSKLSGNPRRETQHKDNKSHNVNIRVLSGTNAKKLFLDNIKSIEFEIKGAKFYIDYAKRKFNNIDEVNHALTVAKYKLKKASDNATEFIQKFNFNR